MTGAGAAVGVDVGGTFTDVLVIEDGQLTVEKVPSTPEGPEAGVLSALERCRDDHGVALAAIDRVAHATTVATNAVLERDWARTALLTTAGFRDVLAIGRQDRPAIYDLHGSRPPPIVPRERRYGIGGRLDERGRERTPLDEATVEEIAEEIAGEVDAVAISLLFSFEDDDHERRAATVLESAGIDCPISLSSEVLPEIREYERTVATALNAALRPIVGAYVSRLEAELASLGVEAPLQVMQSGGGLAGAAVAASRPVTTLLSGPAAGVLGAAAVGERLGEPDLLTMDMGGTSCDVALVTDGEPTVSTGLEVGSYPIAVPMVDVTTVGAGGGSIAWLDEGGALRVGPRSAGADPGPVCYGRGGTEPTVTDAHYLLGRIDPAWFLGDVEPDEGAVRRAVEPLAAALDEDVRAAARGVLSVASATMERAVRAVSVDRGVDPRGLTLVAYGGAGPLHAAAVAAGLGVERVVVPHRAGVLSAYGLLASDLVHDRSESLVRPWGDVDRALLADTVDRLAARGRDELGLSPDRSSVEVTLDLRYAGQTHTLTVPAARPVDPEAVERRFHDRHEERFGHARPEAPLELETVRLRVVRPIDSPGIEPAAGGGSLADARLASAPIGFDDGVHEAPVYRRSGVPRDASIDGPAIVAGADHTAVVPTGWRARRRDGGSLVMEVTG